MASDSSSSASPPPGKSSTWLPRWSAAPSDDGKQQPAATAATIKESSNNSAESAPSATVSSTPANPSASTMPGPPPEANGGSNGLWSWLGYQQQPPQVRGSAPAPNAAVVTLAGSTHSQDHNEIIDEKDPTCDDAPIAKPMTPSTSWRSYFFAEARPVPGYTANKRDQSQQQQNEDSVIVQDDASVTPLTPEKSPSPSPKPSRRNVVLPSIESQYNAPDQAPSLFARAMHMIHAMFSRPSPPIASIIRQMKSDPAAMSSKRFVVIGVHGWFPSKTVLRIVGEPTGTSAKFCDETAKAIRSYFQTEHGLTLPLECITLIPLQWEGRVMDRVEKLYHFLVDNPASMQALQSADAIFWTTHSQGTPVSSILLDRLLQEKRILIHRQPICLLAMAGIAHGPFAYLKGNLIVKYFEADAARELFDFMDSSSDISQAFHKALASVLRQGVKTILVGSMQDQVVPLYSAIMASAQHPNILRAMYIDGHVYGEDDFLINLIVFALRLRNAGLSDHGLLVHISDVLAGNLYAWEGGHSTIYEEPDVYGMAPKYLFDTDPVGPLVRTLQEDTTFSKDPKLEAFMARVRWNPYYLTWAMRGIFDDTRINDLFGPELDRLKLLFEQWNPSSTKLRELKFRLEPIKARL